MEEDSGQKEKPKRSGFYSFHDTKSGEPSAEAGSAMHSEDSAGHAPHSEAAAHAQAVYEAEFPAPGMEQQRRKRRLGMAGIVLFTVLLCAAALVAGKLGLGGMALSFTAPQGAGGAIDAKELSFASVYLSSLPWDSKRSETLKPLAKMKNIRSALQFFGKYPPAEIAAMQAAESSIEEAAAKYETLAGTLVSLEAKVLRIETLNESVTLVSGANSELVTLATGDQTGSASLLVVGALPEGAGSALRITCIPVFLYSPVEGTGLPDIFFITIPELVEKAD